MKKITIIVVDDHQIFREGIELILNQFDFIDTILSASNGKEYIDILNKITPDVVLMDINMPVLSGIEATKISKKNYPDIKIIALSMHTDFEYYSQITNAGVDGFITKDTSKEELKTAILKVLNNENFFSQKLLQKIIGGVNSRGEVVNIFSKRETEVLQLICKGFSTQEISEKLFISNRTVERHKENMLSKSNCTNSICLLIYSIKNKIIDIVT